MDSLNRAAVINGVPFTPFNATRTISLSPFPSKLIFFSNSRTRVRVRVSSSFNPDVGKNSIVQTIKSTSQTLILTVATALMIGKLSQFPARAEPPVAVVEGEEKLRELQEEREDKEQEKNEESPLSQFLESHSEAIDALKSLLQRKLEDGEDEEALKILKHLVSAQPLEIQWKFLMARLLNEIGEKSQSREVYEEILTVNPLNFDALFQNSLLMDQCGEGQVAIQRLEETLKLAEEEQKEKEARDVRLIMAQIQFLQKNVDEALKSYEDLAKEDPKDFRPYFCQGVIYTLLDRNKEAKEQFAKCREISPKEFEVEGFLQSPLSRAKLFGTDSDN